MEILMRAMKELNIKYDEGIIQQFETDRKLVLEWNKKVNLTAIREPEAFEIKHFVDSLLCCVYPAFQRGKRIIDIGTGAGFPGIPLAICFPQKEFVLVDSLNKRIKILNEIIEALGLSNVTAINGRAEDLARMEQHREQYDICLARAVANLTVLAEYCMPFVKVGGSFGAYKARNTEEEIHGSHRALQLLGGRLETKTTVPLDGVALEHEILWIIKTKPIPAKFPRKAGIPEKAPLL